MAAKESKAGGLITRNKAQSKARTADITAIFNNTDISSVVNKYLMSMSITDCEDDEADDLQIKLEDREGDWLQKWLQDVIEDSSGPHRKTTTKTKTTKIDDLNFGLYKEVTKGSTTYEAALCQLYLQALGFYNGAIKAKADANLATAIRYYQQVNSLGATGKCNRMTWRKLCNAAWGKTIPLYTFTFTASKKMIVRKKMRVKAKKVVTIPRGKKGTVLEKSAVGWYKVKYGGKTGYVKADTLKLSAVTLQETQRTGKKLKRTRINAKITVPMGTKRLTRTFGYFELDDIKAGGPPSTVTIKGTSLEYSGLRSTEHSKTWKNTTLKSIAKRIANRHGLGLLWDCRKNKKYNRAKQDDETDIAFLKRLCQNTGNNLKITGGKIVIYEQAKYEALKAIATFTCGDKSYLKWNCVTGEGQTHYDICNVSYTNPKTKKAITGSAKTYEWKQTLKEEKDKKAKDKTKPVTLNIRNQRVTSKADANALAEQRLKLANKFEREATLTIPGNPLYCAGMTITLKKFGYWSGKYLINKCKHDISTSSGFTTTLTLRKIDKTSSSKNSSGSNSYNVGDTVKFKGGWQYSSPSTNKHSGKKRSAGKAKIMKISAKAKHPYKLQGGLYNKVSGKCNVNGWVDASTIS